MHKCAKDLLVQWLRDKEDKYGSAGFHTSINHNTEGLTWRANYGVYSELKFYETSDPYYFEHSGGIINPGKKNETNPDSLFDPSFDRGKILFVPDITAFHKGVAQILIEIVHTNNVSDKKLKEIKDFYGDMYFEIWTINAQSILVNTSVPDWLNFQLLYKNIPPTLLYENGFLKQRIDNN